MNQGIANINKVAKKIVSRIKPCISTSLHSTAAYMVYNLLLAMFIMMLARFVFVAWNWNFFRETMTAQTAWNIFRGGVRFDLATLFYLNGLWILLFLLPLHWKEHRIYNIVTKVVYVVVNSVGLMLNLFDTVYAAYTYQRTTASFIAEFSHESNGGAVVGHELGRSWILLLLFIVTVWFMWRMYLSAPVQPRKFRWKYYIERVLTLIVTVLIAIASIRGGFTRTTRPITISNAYEYVKGSFEAAAVLNTPFSIIRTLGKPAFVPPDYMSLQEAEATFSYHRQPLMTENIEQKPMNVVILIVESFSRGYIGALNKEINDSTWKGYTPCVDKLIANSLTYKHSYANGMKSIDGMPSVLSSIPMMMKSFFLTPASMNDLSSIAGYLGKKGYTSAFFHGAPNGSMGFEAFANHSGFDRYVGMDEYCNSPRHNGKDDFDGTWAIWDEPFLQFFAEELNEMPQPFVAGVFTASSHNPFKLPAKYVNRFPEEGGEPLLKCIRYTDLSIGEFFKTAAKMPWFENTLFILTSDHSMRPVLKEYNTDLERYAAPIIFYAPSDSTLRGIDHDRIAQQIDILPTVLNYLGFDEPYVGFGIDLFNTPPEQTWAYSFSNELHQFVRDGIFIQFCNDELHAVYAIESDPLLGNNLLPRLRDGESVTIHGRTITPEEVADQEHFLKAFIQQYCTAMSTNDLLPKSPSGEE